ncbi:MAG: hypothetical protein EOP11_24850 [Proteobacteria bacterium]|nr:MAG: hypothetical protein EOP11_24850 [Pseudomonadota bacterium]
MKRFLLLAWMLVMVVPQAAHAGNAAPFKGVYDIVEPTYPNNPGRHYMLVDVDTLEKIWASYSRTELPANLVPFKDETAVIVGFNDRDTLFLTFEKMVLTTPTYMSISGVESSQLELQRNADGTFLAAVQEHGSVSRLKLSAPTPIDPPAEETR